MNWPRKQLFLISDALGSWKSTMANLLIQSIKGWEVTIYSAFNCTDALGQRTALAQNYSYDNRTP